VSGADLQIGVIARVRECNGHIEVNVSPLNAVLRDKPEPKETSGVQSND
jgi:hypothetical protein